ncbi:hypothetical protein AMTRI_Chr05g62050 [Amborella trichopoda]
MIVGGSKRLIHNPSQAQARNPDNFLQSWCCLARRTEESVCLILNLSARASRSGKFTWQEVMFKMPIIETEAKKVMSSGHCRAKRNQSLNLGSMTGKPLTHRVNSPY